MFCALQKTFLHMHDVLDIVKCIQIINCDNHRERESQLEEANLAKKSDINIFNSHGRTYIKAWFQLILDLKSEDKT